MRAKGFSLSACYVLPIEDSMESIFRHQACSTGSKVRGGTGFSFSTWPAGDVCRIHQGLASRPGLYPRLRHDDHDVLNRGVRQRRNMGSPPVDHPTLWSLSALKSADEGYQTFNLSVGITDQFMEGCSRPEKISLRFGGGPKTVARTGIRCITDCAWETWNRAWFS
jgi:ribonucleoside-diphosphate reductase alpha chain